MSSNTSSTTSTKVQSIPSEDVVARKFDACAAEFVVNTGIGFSVGVIASVLLFRRRMWPVALGTGWGAGEAYHKCNVSFNPYALPGTRVLPHDHDAASAVSSGTSSMLDRSAAAGAAASSNASATMSSLKNQASSAANNLTSAFKNAASSAKNAAQNAESKVSDKASEVSQKVSDKASEVSHKVSDKASEVAHKVKQNTPRLDTPQTQGDLATTAVGAKQTEKRLV